MTRLDNSRVIRAATGTKLVTAHTMLVSIDRTARPVPIPLEIRAVLERAQGLAG